MINCLVMLDGCSGMVQNISKLYFFSSKVNEAETDAKIEEYKRTIAKKDRDIETLESEFFS